MIIYDQFGAIQNLQRTLILQNSNWSGTIFDRFLQQTGSSNYDNLSMVQRIIWHPLKERYLITQSVEGPDWGYNTNNEVQM